MFDADVFVQVWPVNTFALSDQAKIPALFRRALIFQFHNEGDCFPVLFQGYAPWVGIGEGDWGDTTG